jgi:hypothetical protein
MSSTLPLHLKKLRKTLLALKAVGDAGFEGLLAEALAVFSGLTIRLAKSGSQFGFSSTVKLRSAPVGAGPGRSSNSHQKRFGEHSVSLIVATCRSPTRSSGNRRTQPSGTKLD